MKNKKKMLIVINSLNYGGAEKSLISFLSTLDFKKFDVDLQMFNSTGELKKLLPKEVIILPEFNFIIYSRLSLINKMLSFNLKYLYSLIKLKVNLKKNKILHDAQVYWKCCGKCFEKDYKEYDVAIGWGQGNPTHFVSKCVNSNVKFAWINADYEKVGHNKEFDYPYYCNIDYIIAVSNQLKDKLKDVFPDYSNKIHVILDILNEEVINKMANENNPFKNEKSSIIVTTGRLVKPKGYGLLIEAAKMLKERNIQFKWYIIGEGPERKYIEEFIKQNDLLNNVILLGAQFNPYPYMKNCDIYVQTSISEGYCITLAEARLLNKPIVTTNFEVVFDQIKNNENGVIVQRDIKQITNAIINLIRNKEIQNKYILNLKKEKKGNVEEINKFYLLVDSYR